MSINISLTIEEVVKKKKISYIEAILEYTESVDGEIEKVAKKNPKKIQKKPLKKTVLRIFHSAHTFRVFGAR